MGSNQNKENGNEGRLKRSHEWFVALPYWKKDILISSKRKKEEERYINVFTCSHESIICPYDHILFTNMQIKLIVPPWNMCTLFRASMFVSNCINFRYGNDKRNITSMFKIYTFMFFYFAATYNMRIQICEKFLFVAPPFERRLYAYMWQCIDSLFISTPNFERPKMFE